MSLRIVWATTSLARLCGKERPSKVIPLVRVPSLRQRSVIETVEQSALILRKCLNFPFNSNDSNTFLACVSDRKNSFFGLSIKQIGTAFEKDGIARFRLELDNARDTETRIEYRLDGSATLGSDYLSIPDFAIIPPNQSAIDVEIPLLDDNLVEGLESIIVSAVRIAGFTFFPSESAIGVIRILDDEAPSGAAYFAGIEKNFSNLQNSVILAISAMALEDQRGFRPDSGYEY